MFATNLTITTEIREDMRLMQSQIVSLGEKIDANSREIHANAQAVHADISKLTAKIEVLSHIIEAEIEKREIKNSIESQ